MEEGRQDPEKLLMKVKMEEERRHKGTLKIFFGYAAGVGKTYTMLEAAHEAKNKGIDVVAGYVEPHARPETTALLEGLECLPTKTIVHNQVILKEFDIDLAMKRKPQLILVDELAHTNATGSRHDKRYQDVEELLNAGIDVYTTVNVQHIESLNDIVSSITGIYVRERIPDSVFDDANQVEIVDIEPQDLLDRLKSGKVYQERQAGRAMQNFFTLENLTALREIALRRCADHVNSINENRTNKTHDDYHTDEHILVCLSSSPSNAKIIRTAARMAHAFKGTLTAIFVETSAYKDMNDDDLQRLKEHIHLAEQLGAKIETVYGDNIAFQISEYARLSHVSKIVIGRDAALKGNFNFRTTLVEKLIGYAPQVDIHVIPDSKHTNYLYREKKSKIPLTDTVYDIIVILGILAIATFIGFVFKNMGFEEANIIMVFVFAVLIISVLAKLRISSIFSSLASVLTFNFFFTEPVFSLKAYDPGYPFTFFIMFLSAILTSTLAVKLKSHAKQTTLVAYRTKILLDTSQSLQKVRSKHDIMNIAANQLIQLLHSDIVVYGVKDGTLLEPVVFYADKDHKVNNYVTDNERAIALWVFKNNKHAGATTHTLSNGQCLYLAVRVNQNVYGVIGVAIKKQAPDAFQKSIMLSILGECALALENAKNAREKEEAAVLAKNEQLRANLLRAISHDLRTPLTSISGNASNLISNGESFDDQTKLHLYEDIYDDSMWLINLVENLLSVTRLEGDRVNLRLSSELMMDVIDEALKHISRKKSEHHITVDYDNEFLLVQVDARLIVQVIINLVDNAIKYTPKGSHIHIHVKEKLGFAQISVEDDGPGIPDEMKPRIFDMFYSGANKVADSHRSLGLGLSLCKSIVLAHGGKIKVKDHDPQGTVFTFTLPIREVDIHE